MPLSAIRLPRKTGRTVREVVASWRRLSGEAGRVEGGRTLIACSGGGDSCGLVLALAAGVTGAGARFVVGHVVHDLRAREGAAADRDAAAELAAALGLRFVSAEVCVRGERGNAEGVARRLRYAALGEMAREAGCGCVATAHHAGDQLESILMALVRGAGPAGLAGGAAARRVGGVRVIRPALGVAREELRELCREAGWEWREDATNADTTKLRAALRHGVVPALEAIRPGVARRAARSAELMADAARVVGERARELGASAIAVGGEGLSLRARNEVTGRVPTVPVREGEVGNAALRAANAASSMRTRHFVPGSSRKPGAESAALELSWFRELLRGERGVVLGALIRGAATRLRGRRSHDRLGLKTIEPLIRAIRSKGTDPKRFVFRGLAAEVTAHTVTLRCTDG